MKNLTDMELRAFGFEILAKVLGDVNAERFITLTIREPYDYTAWRERHMYIGESVHDVAERARTAAKRHDEMKGDYTQWRENQFKEHSETIEELAEKIKAYTPHRRRRPAMA